MKNECSLIYCTELVLNAHGSHYLPNIKSPKGKDESLKNICATHKGSKKMEGHNLPIDVTCVLAFVCPSISFFLIYKFDSGYTT